MLRTALSMPSTRRPPEGLTAPGRRTLGACCAVLLAFACEPTGPDTPIAQVAVDLTTDIPTLGAVAFVIHPPADGSISQVTPTAGYAIYQRALPDGLVRVILVGTLSTGEVLRFTIPDRAEASGYSLTNEGGAVRVSFDLIDASQVALTARLIDVVPQ
ncbi:MAG TPA: hypothetical protein VGA37_06880 [Gemmatimonadales bacterium]